MSLTRLGQRVGALLVALCALVGCSDAEPGGGDGDVPQPSTFACEPACTVGFACDDGTCVPACEPACPAGTTCTDQGTCVSGLDEGPSDAVRANPCGGRLPLEGQPGDPCGPCGEGRWLCASDDVVTCVDPIGTNACGTCDALPAAPGEACEGGAWACTLEGDLACVEAANACGGSEPIGGAPGRPCGECHAGTYACDGPNALDCLVPDGPIDCSCDPSESRVVPCGRDTGTCERGVRECRPDGSLGACVVWALGERCEADADCGSGYCVREQVHPFESLDDACVRGDEAECERHVCRSTDAIRACEDDADCADSQGCMLGICERLVTGPTAETCNGRDDDCNGKVDDDERRTEICGVCPYNTLLVTNPDRDFGRTRLCLDVTEATRVDATDVDPGTSELFAQPAFGVLPWTDVSAEQAIAACAGEAYNAQIPGGVVRRRLCLVEELALACHAEGAAWPYGEPYREAACADASIGVDAPLPTASFADCTYTQPGGRFPHWDVVGNAAEWARGPDELALFGGSFRDADASCAASPPALAPAGAVGFRCCAAPLVGNF